MRVSVFAAALTIVLGSVALAGCGDATAPQPAAALGEPFFIRGSIAETGKLWGTFVRGEGSPRYPLTSAYVTVGPSTLIQRERKRGVSSRSDSRPADHRVEYRRRDGIAARADIRPPHRHRVAGSPPQPAVDTGAARAGTVVTSR